MNTSRRLFRVERSAVSYIKFIFEAYDGIAVVETIDPDETIIALHIAPGCEADVEFVLSDLRNTVHMTPVSHHGV